MDGRKDSFIYVRVSLFVSIRKEPMSEFKEDYILSQVR